jgi:hypothetical protein
MDRQGNGKPFAAAYLARVKDKHRKDFRDQQP